jgi:CheY-like chemotaxis protein
MSPTRSRTRQLRSLHLLLVDDSRADSQLVEVMLRGVRGDQDRLTSVSTAAAACHALTGHDDIDLVLLDLRLPDSQGIGTVRRMFEVARDVPIIVLTETDDEEVGLDCVAAGAQDYLPKSELRALLLGRVIEYAVVRSRDSAARRQLEQEVLESSEHERQRIARDLHDDLGQQLTGIAIMARALATMVEHHFLEEYSHSSAPELFLTAVAMQTQRIRVGHGAVVCVPEINHPIRVAERAAFLDLLSGGRLEFGTARSSTWTEIGGFEADPDDTNVHLVHTPRGLRLVQVDPDFDVARAERGRPLVDHFDTEAWRCAGLRPSAPVSFSIADVTLPALRYVCRPEVPAFLGTERVDG